MGEWCNDLRYKAQRCEVRKKKGLEMAVSSSPACSPGREGVRENMATSLKGLLEKPCPQVSVE